MQNFEKFYALHFQDEPFILPNVWNVAGARVAEKLGFEAIATSSGAISDSLGYKDGEQIPFDEMLYIVKRIKTSTNVLLTVDFEKGYANDKDQLTSNLQQLLDAGVSGINIEDSEGEEVYLEKLSTIAAYLHSTKQQIFINARTDAFQQKLPDAKNVVIKRATLYKKAGAHGLFVIGVRDAALIKELADNIELPLNVVAQPGIISAEALAACGVHRISMAVMLYKAANANMENMLQQINNTRSFDVLY